MYEKQNVPPAAQANPYTSEIVWPTEEQRQRRAQMLNEPMEGPCIPLIWWAILSHETKHISQFSEVAAQQGTQFGGEFERLTGDKKRMEKLSKGFPRETYGYLRTIHNAHIRVQHEIDAYNEEKSFFIDVRNVLERICKPYRTKPGKPTVRRPEFTIPPLHQP